jgi:hypothetical protein
VRTLPDQYRKYERNYKLVRREGDIAMYETDWGYARFEVMRISHREDYEFPNGAVTEGGEWEAKTSEWGTNGFTCLDRKAADKKFDFLVALDKTLVQPQQGELKL